VHVGGVEKVDAEVERTVDGRDRLAVVVRAVELRHPHAAEADGGDGGTEAPELSSRDRHAAIIECGASPGKAAIAAHAIARARPLASRSTPGESRSPARRPSARSAWRPSPAAARAPSPAAASAPEVRRLTLKPRREGPVRGAPPWIFSGAIAAGLEGAEPGEPVAVHAASGRFLAAGYCNPHTPITVRVLTHEEEAIDAALVRRRLDEALALRQAALPADLDAYRVLNGEGDRLPGVVVDRYGDFLVCQFLTAGAARLAPAVVEGLGERLAPRGIFERSEGAVRTEERLAGA